MANKKISELTEKTATSKDDLLVIVDSEENETKKISVGNFGNLAIDTTTTGHEEEVVLVKTKNLFSKNDISSGSFTSTGTIDTSTTNFVTNSYIKVDSGTSYTFHNFDSSIDRLVVCEYDSGKTFIQRDIVLNNNTLTITTTSTTAYVRLCSVSAYIDTLQFELGSTYTTYTDFVKTELDTLNNGTYEKYTDTINVGVDSNNSGVWVKQTKNLFNKNDVTLNSAINTSTGEITSWDNHYATGYINVKGAETIYVSGNGTGSYYGVLYDSSKNYISDVSRSGAGTITIPSNAYYYRATVMGSSYLDTMQVEVGSTATDYTPYILSEIDTLQNGSYTKYTDTTQVGYDSNNAGVHFKVSKNLYNNTLLQAGYFTASTGALTTGDSNWYYQYVSVKPNTTYTISGITTTNDGIGASEFNSSKTFVQTALVYKNGTFTTSSTTYYVGVSVRVGENDTFMLEVGDTATSYEPYVTPSILVNNNGEYETMYSKGTILYNGGDTGSNSTSITLNDSASNYDYIEIFFRSNDNVYGTTRIYDADGKWAWLSMMYVPTGGGTSTTHYWKQKECYISDKTITVSRYSESTLTTGTAPTISVSANNIYICKVVGYK